MGIHGIMPALPVLLLASLALEVSGHGGMVWPPIWQDGHYTSLNKITGYKIYSDPKVKDPNTGLSIADARAWLTDQAYIGGHGDNFKTTVGRRGSCTSVGLLRFCQTCLRIRIMNMEKETFKGN